MKNMYYIIKLKHVKILNKIRLYFGHLKLLALEKLRKHKQTFCM